jgi:hypothetical protein
MGRHCSALDCGSFVEERAPQGRMPPRLEPYVKNSITNEEAARIAEVNPPPFLIRLNYGGWPSSEFLPPR